MKSQTENKQQDLISQSPTISSISSSKAMDLSLSLSCDSTQSLTQSITNLQINSIPHKKQLPLAIQFESPVKNNSDQNSLECTIEKPRLNLKENEVNDGLDEFTGFVGFVQGGKKKPVQINESKMKKAAQFFNDTPYKSERIKKQRGSESQQSDESRDECSLFGVINEQKKQNKSSNSFEHDGSFSCGFMNAKTGSTITISKDLAQKAKQFLEDQPAEHPQYSEKKPTKFKAPKVSNSSSLLKTVTWEEKKKGGTVIGNKKKPEESKQKKILAEINIEKLVSKFEKIKISDLPEVTKEQLSQFQQFWTNFNCFEQKFIHNNQQCKIVSCYFCKKFRIIQKEESSTTQYDQIISQLIAIINSKHQKQQYSTFYHNLYLIVVFKLQRYVWLYPTIKFLNQSYNPNSILLELLKKYKKIQQMTCDITDRTTIGPLADSIRIVANSKSKTLGRALNLCIVRIDESIQSKYIFILLTDGWSFAYAVISSKNLLYPILSNQKYQNKIKIGMKICIVDWDMFFIKNILDFHPHSESLISNSPAIDISYNNSRLISPNTKLGSSRDIFFRPIHKYKRGGGTIPVIEGIIVRMFSRKGTPKIPTQNFIQILSCSTTYLMKFQLPQQMALSDLFSLYTCYEFRRIKLPLSKSGHDFQFYDQSSFTEISKGDRLKQIQNLLRSRLLNIHKKMYETQLYADLIVKEDKFLIGEIEFLIQESVPGSLVLLQQYSFERKDDKCFYVRRGVRGAQVSRVPKIYSSLQYPLL